MAKSTVVKKAIKPFALILGTAFGFSWLAELICADDDSTARSLGFGKKALKSFFEVGQSVLGEQFGGLTETIAESFSYGTDTHLQHALKTAYKESLEKVRNDFLVQNSIIDPAAREQ